MIHSLRWCQEEVTHVLKSSSFPNKWLEMTIDVYCLGAGGIHKKIFLPHFSVPTTEAGYKSTGSSFTTTTSVQKKKITSLNTYVDDRFFFIWILNGGITLYLLSGVNTLPSSPINWGVLTETSYGLLQCAAIPLLKREEVHIFFANFVPLFFRGEKNEICQKLKNFWRVIF